MEESNRIKRLKNSLIKELPYFPNDKSVLDELESQGLNGVLIHYLHWKSRVVPPRNRKVIIAPEVTSDQRYKFLKNGIGSLLDKIRNAEDIFPYHSKRAHNKAYTPAQRVKNGEVDSWEDKDQILNTTGFHHFHLDMNVQDSGISNRTNEVLFAYVTRDTFHAIGIFDHSVFESSDSNGNLNKERSRVWKLHDKYTGFGLSPGSLYMSNPITTSGHPTQLVIMCNRYTKAIFDYDSKLDSREFVNTIYDNAKLARPKSFKLEWCVDALDICIIDKKNNVLFTVFQGHI